MSCGCSSNFDGEMASEEELGGFDNFSGDYQLGFDGGFVDDNDDEFDDFLTKKMRARRKARKELEASGMSKADARKQALEQIPRDSLKQVIANFKNRKKADNGVALTDEQKQAIAQGGLDAVQNALNNQSGGSTSGGNTNGSMGDDGMGEDDETQAGFLAKNGKYIAIIGVLAIGGFFAYKQFAGKGKS